MKTKQLIEIENVKGANRVLKNLLERTRTEIVGIGLFYGKPGLGKTRWMTKTAMENGFIYLRLEVNITTKDFLRELLTRLLHKTMPYYQVKGTQNEIYNQILDILQRDQNITILIDEIDYAFNNDKILESIRDMADQSLATFVLAGMESSREGLLKHSPHFSGNLLYRIYKFIDDTHTAIAFGVDKFGNFMAYFNFTNLSDDHFSILKAQLPEQMGGTGSTEKMGTML